MATEKTTPGLVIKLATIMGELGSVEKKGFNKAQNYRFVRESDVVAALVPLLSKHHIMLHTTITSHDRSPLYTTNSGAQMWLTTITADLTWIDGDTGETFPVSTYMGYGADTGDKGIYKAVTGAEKYALMKTFLISTGDDPEADEKVDKAAATAGAAAGPRISKGSQPGVQRGGKSAVITTVQIKEIARLISELHINAAAFGDLVSSISGVAVEGKTGKEILSQLTSEQASEIIVALSGMATFADVAVEEGVEKVDKGPSDEPDEDEQQGFSIV
jgi:hypothetical protein